MDLSTTDLILNISPATIRTMSAIAASMAVQTVSVHYVGIGIAPVAQLVSDSHPGIDSLWNRWCLN